MITSILVLFSITQAYSQIKGSFDLKYWLARGYLNWTVAGYTEDPYFPGWLTRFRSELDWDVNTNMIVFNGGVRPISWFSIDGTYGTGAVQQGICTDTDWLLDYSSSIPWIQTENPGSGNCHFYDFDVSFRVLGANSHLGSLDIFMGYGSTSINMVDTDPLSYSYYEWVYLGGYDTYPGLDSTYDIVYRGLRVGTKGEIRPVPLLGLSASIAYSPSLDIDGEGFWNLRTDVDPAGWRFYQSGKGNSLGYNFGLSIIPSEYLSLELGYMGRVFSVTESRDWESCETKKSGMFISGILKV